MASDGPPQAQEFGLSSEWDAAGNGDPGYHRDEAQESFKGAALSLVFFVPGLILTSFPAIRWWGVLTLVVLGLFGGFMFVNLLAIGVAELKRSRMMRDPAVADAARRYHAALVRWKQEVPPDTHPPAAMTLEQARGILQDYTRQLGGADRLPSPVCRPVSQLPYPKDVIQEAFRVVVPYVSPEVEVEFRASYAQLAYFIPDGDFDWVEEAYRRSEAATQAGDPREGPDLEPRLRSYALQRDAEWQALLKEIHDYAEQRRRRGRG
jgi:hypothetical protein